MCSHYKIFESPLKAFTRQLFNFTTCRPWPGLKSYCSLLKSELISATPLAQLHTPYKSVIMKESSLYVCIMYVCVCGYLEEIFTPVTDTKTDLCCTTKGNCMCWHSWFIANVASLPTFSYTLTLIHTRTQLTRPAGCPFTKFLNMMQPLTLTWCFNIFYLLCSFLILFCVCFEAANFAEQLLPYAGVLCLSCLTFGLWLMVKLFHLTWLINWFLLFNEL